MKLSTKFFNAVLLISLSVFAVGAQDDFAEAVSESSLIQVNLPTGSMRVRDEYIPAQITQMLTKLLSGSDKFTQGDMELIVWAGKNFRASNSPKLRGQFENSLKSAGWDYQIVGQEGEMTVFTAIKKSPERRNITGFWVADPETLMLTMGEVFVGEKRPLIGASTNVSRQTGAASAQTFNLSASDDFVNVMGNEMPKMPAFPALTKKPNRLCGYVKDTRGNPLEGAYIGVRSSAIGGRYSGASAETDAKGYYEMEVPFGAAHFYAAGYTIDYGSGRAAVALHPADGKAGSFVSADGAVENFVMLPYGIADRDATSEKPWFSSSYYGGAIRIGYDISSGDMWASKGSLPAGAEIEITLTPDGEMLGEAAGKSFVVRRKTGGINNLNINNIPVGRYKISAKLMNGKQLKLKQNAYSAKPLFGLNPAEAVGSATVLFVPSGAQSLSAQPNRGNWQAVDIKIEIP